jgi:hypothetical protein
MRGKIYRVRLPEDERRRLEELVSKGVHPAWQITGARVLLLLNEEAGRAGKPVRVSEQTDRAERCGCTTGLVYTVSKQYVEEGLERVLNRKKRKTPPVPAKVTGEVEAKIIALSCGEPPAGYGRWTLRLLAGRSREGVGVKPAYTADSTGKCNTPAFSKNLSRGPVTQTLHRR